MKNNFLNVCVCVTSTSLLILASCGKSGGDAPTSGELGTKTVKLTCNVPSPHLCLSEEILATEKEKETKACEDKLSGTVTEGLKCEKENSLPATCTAKGASNTSANVYFYNDDFNMTTAEDFCKNVHKSNAAFAFNTNAMLLKDAKVNHQEADIPLKGNAISNLGDVVTNLKKAE